MIKIPGIWWGLVAGAILAGVVFFPVTAWATGYYDCEWTGRERAGWVNIGEYAIEPESGYEGFVGQYHQYHTGILSRGYSEADWPASKMHLAGSSRLGSEASAMLGQTNGIGTTNMPEPATIGLLLLGFLGILRRRMSWTRERRLRS